jgi:hypothetical protein
VTPTPAETPPASATPTPTAPPAVCAGDCGGNGEVTVDELLLMVNIALGNTLPSQCVAGDKNHDGAITIDEILTAVNNALTGCPAPLVCGGFADVPCPSGHFCELPAGTCNAADLQADSPHKLEWLTERPLRKDLTRTSTRGRLHLNNTAATSALAACVRSAGQRIKCSGLSACVSADDSGGVDETATFETET